MLGGVDALTRLALQSKAGDRGALEALVGASYEQVWRLCASLVDEESAEDLAQETFLRAVPALAYFRADASARTWLLAVARKACMDELRARSRRRRRDKSVRSGLLGSEPVAPDTSSGHAVADMVRRLEPERRAAFVLTQVIGLTYDEAAEVCECPSGTIRSRVARARQDLLGLLGEADASEPERGSAPSA